MLSQLKSICLVILILFYSCKNSEDKIYEKEQTTITNKEISLLILGTLQDGGSPHAGCEKNCCKNLFDHPDFSRQVVSLGISDPLHQQTYLIEASPDLPKQLRALRNFSGFKNTDIPNGVFLSHAHIGHYSGLQFLGREVMNAKEIPIYAMPRMTSFLENNGPWSQLVNLKNISIHLLQKDAAIQLNNQLTITAIQVPHRDEFSETVGFLIQGPNKRVLFIPDIDKWEKWDRKIEEEILKVDYIFIDGTFYDEKEINNRNISEIPHPFIIESMERFKNLEVSEKNKIYFIHFNHTNPLLDASSEESKTVKEKGFNIAQRGQVFAL